MVAPQREYLPGTAKSSVHIFGATLEKADATMQVKMNLPIQVAYKSEKPEWRVDVVAEIPGNYKLAWDFCDVEGGIVASGQRNLTFGAGKMQQQVVVPTEASTGWYATRFQLTSASSLLLDHRSAFVILPPDTRKAGFESPYGTWLFHSSHRSETDIERVGPLLQKAGLRHTTLPPALPESVTGKFGVTNWAVPWRPSKKATVAERVADHEALIANHLALWPSVDKMLVWHESGDGGAPFPPELLGLPTQPPTAAVEKNWQERLAFLTPLAAMVREKFPTLKMQYGNDGSSVNMIGELLRRKFPRKYIDTIASEEVGQTILPEYSGTGSVQSTWYLRETARKLGYADVPVTAAYEWVNRRAATLGPAAQAQWYIRDALHARAYGFDTIALGTIRDAGSGYFHTIWGAGGLVRRYPSTEPRPAYAAIATHTRVLDSSQYERAVPTGLITVNVLEFKRGAEWVYAMWAPGVARAMRLQFAANTRLQLLDLYGREKPASGPLLAVTLTPAAQYLVSTSRLLQVVAGNLEPREAVTADSFPVDRMEKADNWVLQLDQKRWEQTGNIPHWKAGEFVLREVVDDEMGACLELELIPKGDLWPGTHEYAVIQLKTPLHGTANYTSAGVWVKGNGGWGDIDPFLLAPGSKVPFLSMNVRNSWTGAPAINFEGWHFKRFPLDRRYPLAQTVPIS